MRENLISQSHIRYQIQIFSFQQQQKNHKAYKETEKYVLIKGKNKPAETVSEKDLVAYLIHKDLKTTVLQILKEL